MEVFLSQVSNILVPKNTILEIECRYFMDARKNVINNTLNSKGYDLATLKTYIKKLIEKYSNFEHEIIQSINFINDNNIKQLNFHNGVQQKNLEICYSKTKIVDNIILLHNYLPNCRLSFNFETKIDDFSVSLCKLARIRLRYSIKLPNWKLEITLVKSINDVNNVIDPLQLKSVKNSMLFPISTLEFMEKAPWDIADNVEFELEYCGELSKFPNNLSTINEVFDQIINLPNYSLNEANINNTNVNNKQKYQQLIYSIAKMIRPIDSYKFKRAEGLKQLSNQVIELDKNMFLKDVLGQITKFYITDKVDGKRAIVYISNESYALTDTLTKLPISIKDVIILDTEFYEGNYYIFDILVNANRNLVSEPFNNRYKIFNSLVDELNSKSDIKLFKTKPFILLNDNFQTQILNFKLENKPYNTDGIVLTPYSGKYLDMKVYKYKPIERLSIDFLIKKCPDKLLGINPYIKSKENTLYLLFSGIRGDVFKRLKMQFVKHYEDIFPTVDIKRLPNYMPIQFQPSDMKFNYLYESKDSNLDGLVGEFGYNINNKKWELHLIRDDRKADVERGNYFGNNYKVAEMTWLSYETPLVIEKLDLNKEAGYFQLHDNELQKASRNFNSFVKSNILNQFSGSNWVMDLASGKGQDLFRYTNVAMNNLVFLEIDHVALQELIYRKHEYANSRSNTHMAIYTQQLDLNTDYKNNTEKIISNLHLEINTMDVIICNFALHYLIADKKAIINLFKFVSTWLKPGGRFAFTTFNANKVVKLLNEHNGNWTAKTETNLTQYSIKKSYTTTMLENVGQQIDVLLPFSNDKYYTEYLVNIDYITEQAEKLGFTLEIDESFSNYLLLYKEQNLQGYNLMSNIDKQYSSLYHYYCFHKIKK